tara:strand:- start:1497 stop:2198 length:702 start_codon:yes stop_codon:yes gene_type:complete
MQKIAYIPARSGSKRFPDKNISLLGKKPLFVWTIEAFINSNCFDKVIFSSDSEKYFEIARDFIGSELLVFHKRNNVEAGDKVKIFDYIKSNISKWCENEDIFALGLPTCPFRNAKHIQESVDLSLTSDKPVFSSNEYEQHVTFSFYFKNNKIMKEWEPAFVDSPLITGNTRSQDQKKYFRPNGGLYITKPSYINFVKTFYENAIPYIMSKDESIDIDCKKDLDYAEFLLSKIN